MQQQQTKLTPQGDCHLALHKERLFADRLLYENDILKHKLIDCEKRRFTHD